MSLAHTASAARALPVIAPTTPENVPTCPTATGLNAAEHAPADADPVDVGNCAADTSGTPSFGPSTACPPDVAIGCAANGAVAGAAAAATDPLGAATAPAARALAASVNAR